LSSGSEWPGESTGLTGPLGTVSPVLVTGRDKDQRTKIGVQHPLPVYVKTTLELSNRELEHLYFGKVS
jgi:hypothetical protein